MKPKINEAISNENFYTSKETNNKMKSQPRKWKKVFV